MKSFLSILKPVVVAILLALFSFDLYPQTFAGRKEVAHHKKIRSSTITLRDALLKIKNHYRIDVLFEEKLLAGIKASDSLLDLTQGVEKNMDAVLSSTGLHYQKVKENAYVIIRESPPTADPPDTGREAQRNEPPGNDVTHEMVITESNAIIVTGRVTDEKGIGMPGVNVLVKGTSNGTATDNNGDYTLSAPDENGTLLFSFIGYVTQEVPINNRSTINIALALDLNALQEVVVVGYGTQEKKDVTGSVGTISGKAISSLPVASVDQALQGKLAGVYVSTNSGEPGGGVSIRVRGMGGFGASEPLYVIDGVIITYNDSNTSYNPLATLNMADIESINVLKDASASAIYGARAGNGVVIITTKRGKEGRPRLSFDSYVGFQKVARKLDMMNASEYARFSNDAYAAANQPAFSKFANPASLGTGTNWQDAIFRTAPIQNYQFSLSGGSDKNQYLISTGYLKQDGTIIGSVFDRYSLRVNLDNQITSRLKIGNSLTLSRTYNEALPNNDKFGGIVAQAIRRSPTLPIYDANGGWGGPDALDLPYLGQTANPVRIALLNDNRTERIRGLGNMYVELEVIRDLYLRTSLGIDYLLTNNNSFGPTWKEGVLENNIPYASATKNTLANIMSENTITYKKTFPSKHHLEVLAGYTAQLSTFESVSASSKNHLTNTVTTIDAGDPNPNRQAYGTKGQSSYLSYLGRINYAFQDKYLFTANVRRDGSSVFSSLHKYAIFPSFSAGWRISEEHFMAGLPAISDLKLRGSWGQVGIDGNLGNGTEYATIASGYLYNFGHTVFPGMAANRVPNSNLKWETVTQSDVGIDVGLLDNRISLTADYFLKRYTDMITERLIPIYAGIVSDSFYESQVSQPINSATVINKGFEFSLNYRKSQGAFTYALGVNMTTFNNNVVKLDNEIVGGNTGNTPQGNLTRTVKGRSVGEFYGWLTEGIFQNQNEVNQANALGDPAVPYQNGSTSPGDYRFKDLNGDDVINDKDRTYLGSPIPDFTYGLQANFGYKQFDLSLFFQGVHGNKIANVNRFITESSGGTENKSKDMLQRWTDSNPSLTYPRAIATDPNFNDRFSNRFVENGSYLRLRNIQLGYKLSPSILQKLSIHSLRVYLSAQNLITLTKYKGFNPDIGAQNQSNLNYGVDNSVYPQSITFLGGVNLEF
jgi:TonB-linked SusC/RagA family outer membrane protein